MGIPLLGRERAGWHENADIQVDVAIKNVGGDAVLPFHTVLAKLPGHLVIRAKQLERVRLGTALLFRPFRQSVDLSRNEREVHQGGEFQSMMHMLVLGCNQRQ